MHDDTGPDDPAGPVREHVFRLADGLMDAVLQIRVLLEHNEGVGALPGPILRMAEIIKCLTHTDTIVRLVPHGPLHAVPWRTVGRHLAVDASHPVVPAKAAVARLVESDQIRTVPLLRVRPPPASIDTAARGCIVNIMVNNQARLTTVFSALSDPTRRRILERLSKQHELQVTALAKPFRMSLPAISRHLVVLERARLVTRRRVGRVHLIRPCAAGLKDAQKWIAFYAAHWDAAFDALDRLLQNEQEHES